MIREYTIIFLYYIATCSTVQAGKSNTPFYMQNHWYAYKKAYNMIRNSYLLTTDFQQRSLPMDPDIRRICRNKHTVPMKEI